MFETHVVAKERLEVFLVKIHGRFPKVFQQMFYISRKNMYICSVFQTTSITKNLHNHDKIRAIHGNGSQIRRP